MARKIIRLPEVMSRTGLSQSTIYLFTAEGSFPPKIPLGGRAVGWDSDAVDEWIDQRAAEADKLACMHVDRAAEQIGVPRAALQPYIESGDLPTHRVGKHELVRKAALDSFQRRHESEIGGLIGK